WPLAYVAPNLDVSAIFHARAAEDEWLLCDSDALVARDGLVGCSGRVWSPSGRPIASGSSCLFCRPHPRYEQDLERRRRWDAKQPLWLCLVVSALLTLGGTLGADALAGLFRLEPQTMALAATFTRWLSVFYMAFAAVMALSTALRAAGDVVTPLWIGALGNVVSVFFTYSLVHGAFGLPALGVAGAAIGNGTGFVTGALLLTA